MKRVLLLNMQGNLDLLFELWAIPEGVKYTQHSSGEVELRFYDDMVAHFESLQALIAQHNLKVELDPMFRAHSFTREECEAAELLLMFGRCQDGLGFTFWHEGVPDLQRRSSLEMLSYQPLAGRFIALCGTGHMMHTSLAADLADAGLAAGLHTVATTIEVGEGGPIDRDWWWISSTVDLGTPDSHRRFVSALARERWQGEHWCSSSHYKGGIFIVSQAVYRYLRALPEGDTCEIEFEPLELV